MIYELPSGVIAAKKVAAVIIGIFATLALWVFVSRFDDEG